MKRKRRDIMPLSPLDIHNKEFTRGFRGYAEDEVNEFLEQIMKDLEILLREKKDSERLLIQDYIDSKDTAFYNSIINDYENK